MGVSGHVNGVMRPTTLSIAEVLVQRLTLVAGVLCALASTVTAQDSESAVAVAPVKPAKWHTPAEAMKHAKAAKKPVMLYVYDYN
jgi:hypothetical protein